MSAPEAGIDLACTSGVSPPPGTVSIELTQGFFAIVDEVDADLGLLRWYALRSRKTFYAIRSVKVRSERRPVLRDSSIALHRVIAARMGLDPKRQVDHEDRDGLNCRRSNLRQATFQQNGGNRSIQVNNTSGFKGVSGKWTAQIGVNGKVLRLGKFDSPVSAALAYDRAAREVFGPFAWINFRVDPVVEAALRASCPLIRRVAIVLKRRPAHRPPITFVRLSTLERKTP